MRNYILGLALLGSLSMSGEGIEGLLREVETNNMELKVAREEMRAAGYEAAAGNALDPTSVEYSPFFRKGASGVASSELIISQDFDFPTLYAARSKSGKLQQAELGQQYLLQRREVMLEAIQDYNDLVMLGRVSSMLKERDKIAEELLAAYTLMLKEGRGTALDVNRIKMEQMDLRTELLQNEMDAEEIMSRLRGLNGNRAIELTSDSYPTLPVPASEDILIDQRVSGDLDVKKEEAARDVMVQESKVARQGWLPKLTLGYRRNTELDEASNGFVVGAALPLFSNSNKVKAAGSRQLAAELNVETARLKVENEVTALYAELQKTDKAIKAYDLGLMSETLQLMKKAVDLGRLPIMDYYTEADKIYQKMTAYYQLENRYYRLLTELNKNAL